MRSLSVLLTACSVALALSGCGGGKATAEPKIDRGAAQQLANASESVARRVDAGDVCGAAHEADALRARAQSAVDAGDVPGPLARELLANADALVNELNCPAPPPRGDEDEHGGKDKGKHKGKGRRGGE